MIKTGDIITIEIPKPDAGSINHGTLIEGLGMNGELITLEILGRPIPKDIYNIIIKIEPIETERR